jgi:hypothetical protein
LFCQPQGTVADRISTVGKDNACTRIIGASEACFGRSNQVQIYQCRE